MEIVILDGYTLNPGDLSWEEFKKHGNVTIYDRTPENEIIERIGNAEIVFTNKVVLTKEILEKLPNVKFIGVLATGYNVVDIEAAKNLGIVVTNIPTYSTQAVAQMVFAHLLEVTNQVAIHDQAVKRGQWTNSMDWCFWNSPLMELTGKTMGIVGYGEIGKETAKIAQAFGMKILANARTPRRELETDTLKYVDLEELFGKSDIITLHCPLTEETKGVINKETIGKMKDGVIIINTARGPLIEEEDLAQALNSGKVYGAGVDVAAHEPIPEDSPLLTAKNIFITPHIAWAPKETRQRLIDIAIENLEQFLNGNPTNVVNP